MSPDDLEPEVYAMSMRAYTDSRHADAVLRICRKVREMKPACL